MKAGIAYNGTTDCNMVMSPVDAAAVNGHLDILKALIGAGATADKPGAITRIG